MKKYTKEIVMIIIQMVIFYIYPIYAIKIDPMGMVLLMVMAATLAWVALVK